MEQTPSRRLQLWFKGMEKTRKQKTNMTMEKPSIGSRRERALKTDRDYFRKIIWAAVVAQICFFYRTADLGAITPKTFSSLMPKNRLNLTES